MKSEVIAMLFFIFGLLVFYSIADFEKNAWYAAYCIWDKGKNMIFIWVLYLMSKRLKSLFLITFIFSIIRFIWEIVSLIMVKDINSKPVISFLFILFLILYTIMLFKGQVKWRILKR